MAWPNPVYPGQPILASQFNSLLAALSVWGGNVSAQGFGLADASSVAYRTANASWQEWQWAAMAGPAAAQDTLCLQVNTRSSAAGADSWSTVLSVSAQTGALTISAPFSFTTLGIATVARQQLSVGAALDIYSGSANSPTVPTIRANSNALMLNAFGSASLYLNYDSGAGGVLFCNGAGAAVGRVDAAGNVACGGVATPRQQLSVGAALDLYTAGTANNPSTNSIRAAAGGGLAIQSSGSTSLYLQWDTGTGGVIFGNGALLQVASISGAGILSCTGLSIPKFNGQSVFVTVGPLSNATGTVVSNGGLLVFFLFATCWVTTAGVIYGVNFNIDGTTRCTLKMFFNEANAHRTLPPQIWAGRLSAGTHTVSFTASNAAVNSDNGDFFQVYAIELPI
jgi:hypothetical protein